MMYLFMIQRRYGVDTGAYQDHTVAAPASTALNRDTPCWTGVHWEVARVVYFFFNIRDSPGCETSPAYSGTSPYLFRHQPYLHRKTTAANRHELCPWWRYGDSRLGHGVSKRRAGVAPTLCGRTTVWHGSSRRMPVKVRWSYGKTTV